MVHAIQQCFNAICYLTTICLVVYCIVTYYKNEDYSEISYKKYNEDSVSLYPSITLCVTQEPMTSTLLKEEALKHHGEGVNSSSYLSFLIGHYWDERMVNISFDEVTQNLGDQIVHAAAYYNFLPSE